jgi:hypothetical protein
VHDDLQISTLVSAYALIDRMRVLSSPPVLPDAHAGGDCLDRAGSNVNTGDLRQEHADVSPIHRPGRNHIDLTADNRLAEPIEARSLLSPLRTADPFPNNDFRHGFGMPSMCPSRHQRIQSPLNYFSYLAIGRRQELSERSVQFFRRKHSTLFDQCFSLWSVQQSSQAGL